jgi:DNA sulfur modification protein DndD
VLRIAKLSLTDFGPFKGEQSISFRQEPGVTVIVGENGRGKTWLLNAVRYALFGHVLGRTDTQRDLARVINWESFAEGATSFKVVLEFDVNGTVYRLTRRFSVANAPREEVLLARGANVLTQDETARELDRVLPEQIARFFLFDGELLRQYEELAVDPTRGEELKSAIERILGIPILTNARTDITTIEARVNRALAQAAARNTQTEQLGRGLRQAQDLLDQHQTTVSILDLAITQLEHERAELEDSMSRSARQQALLVRRDALRSARTTEDSLLSEAMTRLSSAASDAWRAIVGRRIDEILGSIEADLSLLRERERELHERRVITEQRHVALESGRCPICGRAVTDNSSLPEEVDADPGALSDATASIESLSRRRSSLLTLRADAASATIEAVESAVEQHRVRVADLAAQIADIDQQLGDAPEAILRDLALRFANVDSSLTNSRARRQDALDQVAAQEVAIRQIRERLARLAGQDQAAIQRKAALLQQLGELFESAIDRYRTQLRDAVEREATRIFRLLSTELDYDRLEISDSYGLTIVHRDGLPITERSAGYEHLVALALLGALQRCAPITGPVIMDSQFGRLDTGHKARVVAALPEISQQVILLAYRNEFDRDQAAQTLGPKLLAEKSLVRITARHTEIRDRLEE